MSTRLKCASFAAATLAAAVLGATSARAEPYLAQREGYPCSQCHVNRTGGGKRTAFGYQYAVTHLDAFASTSPSLSQAGTPRAVAAIARAVDPNLTDWLSVGADLRLALNATFAETAQSTFQMPEANLYAQVDATRWLMLYTDVSVAQGTVGCREAFLLVSPATGFSIKAGYLLPPFGVRIWGEDEFIRKQTGYTFSSPDIGVEFGYDRGIFNVYYAISNGAGGAVDSDNYKKLSARMEFVLPRFRVGYSGSYNRTSKLGTFISGPFAGVTLGRLTLLGEADLMSTRYFDKTGNVHALLAYVEGNFLLMRGLNLKASYGYQDPDLEQPQDGRLRLRAGFDFAPMPLFLTGLYYTKGLSVPQDEIGNAHNLLAELHLIF